MSNRIKLGLYLVFALGACVFGFLTYSSYSRLMEAPAEEPATTALDVPALSPKPPAIASKGYARFLTYGAMFFGTIIVLSLLGAHDLSGLIGSRFVKTVYNEEGEGMQNQEYDQAEQEWADGHHLEAIRLMREYLLRNPREQHVALRIAEIYEKDLHNHLAAALEYEEVLKQKLPDERWGWAAIHLCNLYFKLNQQDKAVALLRRLDAEYPETAAAEKARKRLALLESGGADESLQEPGEIGEKPAS